MSAPSQLSILSFVSTTPGGGHPSIGMEIMLYCGPHHRQVTWTSRRVASLHCLKPFAGEFHSESCCSNSRQSRAFNKPMARRATLVFTMCTSYTAHVSSPESLLPLKFHPPSCYKPQ